MKTYKYGILSTASIVPRFIGGLRDSGTGTVVAIASRDGDKARQKADEWGIPKSYGSYEALIADPEVEVVYVATINSQHYKYSLKALEAGKHVICEKPFTMRAQEARHLFRVAREKGLMVMEAQKSVFLPVMQDVKAVLKEGKLGRIHFLDFTGTCNPSYNPWLHSVAEGGGGLYGNAGYSVHLARYLLEEEPTAWSGLCTKGDSQVDEQCAFSLSFGKSILFSSKISTNVQAINRALIFGDKGYVEIFDHWKARKATVHYNTGEEVVFEHPCQYELMYEIQHFHDCLDKGLSESPVMSEEMTVGTIQMLEDLWKSWGII